MMSEKENWQDIGFSYRLEARIQKKGVRGEPIKSLAELIKNSDDTYYILEKESKKAKGLIDVGYWHIKDGKRSLVTGFLVRDFGRGMSRTEAIAAYGPHGYGEDTAKGGRNGAIGVGGKDALYGMENCNIITIKEEEPTWIRIRTNAEKGNLQSTISDKKAAQIQIKQFNNLQLKVNPIDPSQSGTIVFFKIGKSQPHPQIERAKDRLQKYYTLRNILSDPSRSINLIDVKRGNSSKLVCKKVDGIIVHESQFKIGYSGDDYVVDVIIRKTDTMLEKDRETGYNLLIQDDVGAVLDNTLYGYEDDAAANKLFGEVVIHDWSQLYKRTNGEILTDNREGLDYLHAFNIELRTQVQKILKPLVESERRQHTSDLELAKPIKKNVMDAFEFINKQVEQEAGGRYSGGEEDGHPPPKLDGLAFVPASLDIMVDEERILKLYMNPVRVPEGSRIFVKLDGDGIQVSPVGTITTDSKYDINTIPSLTFSVKGIIESGYAVLKASFEDLRAQIPIIVLNEEELIPETGLAFTPQSLTITKGERRNLRLLIDTKVVKAGTSIELESEDSKLELQSNRLTVSLPNFGKRLTRQSVEVYTNHADFSSKVFARAISTKGPVEAICKVRGKEKETPKEFLKDFKLDDKKDGHQRASYKAGIVYVHVNSPVLMRYFGPEQARLNEEKRPDAVSMLADTILQCVTREWAKYRLEKGVEEQLGGDKQIEIERIRNNIEYQFGSNIHQLIMASYK